jgi:tetratricopeptide (TPR) repeat protein
MRFDPQANFVLPELRAASFDTSVPQVLAARSPLKTALVILAIAFVVGGGMWFWSDGVPGQMKAYGAMPMAPDPAEAVAEPASSTMDNDGAAALIEYANVVMSNRTGEEKLAAVTGRPVDVVEAGKQAKKRAKRAFEAGNEALAMAKYGEAIKHYTEAVEQQPDMAAAHYRLGLAYVRIGNKEAARSEHAALVTLDKDLANLLVNLTR